MAQKFTLDVVAEGMPEPFTIELSAPNIREAYATVEKLASTQGVWRDQDGTSVFCPARRIKEIWVRPQE